MEVPTGKAQPWTTWSLIAERGTPGGMIEEKRSISAITASAYGVLE